jgi:hypothetical protein
MLNPLCSTCNFKLDICTCTVSMKDDNHHIWLIPSPRHLNCNHGREWTSILITYYISLATKVVLDKADFNLNIASSDWPYHFDLCAVWAQASRSSEPTRITRLVGHAACAIHSCVVVPRLLGLSSLNHATSCRQYPPCRLSVFLH